MRLPQCSNATFGGPPRIRFIVCPRPPGGGPGGKPMHRTFACPFLISVALLCASPLAMARDARPSDVGDCRDSVITVPSPVPAPTKRPANAVHKARPAGTTAHTVGGGGGDDAGGAPRVPRWHSFLPGMFR